MDFCFGEEVKGYGLLSERLLKHPLPKNISVSVLEISRLSLHLICVYVFAQPSHFVVASQHKRFETKYQ